MIGAPGVVGTARRGAAVSGGKEDAGVVDQMLVTPMKHRDHGKRAN